MRKYLVGLTGGIGSGKSAAAERFAAHGIACVDADIASRAVVEPGTTALTQIVDYFGQTMLNDDKHLNRSALRHVVFADTNKRQWLQQLLHPLITNYLKTHIAQASSAYVVLVNPLLIETRQNHWCDRVLVIHKGSLICDGQLDRLLDQFAPYREVSVEFDRTQDISRQSLKPYGELQNLSGCKATFLVSTQDLTNTVSALLNNFTIQDLTVTEPPIEDVIGRVFQAGITPEQDAAAARPILSS